MFPVFLARLVGLSHDAIVDGVPRRQDITRDSNLLGTLYSVQQVFCGGGKIVVNV